MKIFNNFDSTGENTSIALGFFDGVHKGHANVIMQAVDCKDLTPCVFTFLENPQKSLNGSGPAALMTNDEKIQSFRKLGIKTVYLIDFSEIMNMEAESFVKDILINKLKARKITCGYNFRFGKGGAGDSKLLSEVCEKNGAECIVCSKTEADGEPISSTLIRKYIENGEMEKANRMLSEDFFYEFTVIHGRHLGTLLGFPTINQIFPADFIRPKFGVYISRVYIDGKIYRGVTNIGVKPTVGSDCCLSETYIIGFDGNLYGKKIKTQLLSFRRAEKKFSGIEELQAQISKDIDDALEFRG